MICQFKKTYLLQFSPLPTNTQFTERGVKESGYVSLGRRMEKKRSILAMARGRVLPDALKKGHNAMNNDNSDGDEVDDSNTKQLCGKMRTKFLMNEMIDHEKKMSELKRKRGAAYLNDRMIAKSQLTSDNLQFKKLRINKKVARVKLTAAQQPRSNVYSRRTGQTLTPLMLGKIQYGKLVKRHNIEAIRQELRARRVEFLEKTKWADLIKSLK